jgi:ferredoxin-thioredoxin reductase catalytic chain
VNDQERKPFLRSQCAQIVDLLGFKFTLDEELVNDCLGAEVALKKQLGAPYCPCQGRMQTRAEDTQIVCPYIPYHRAHYDAMRRCWRGLFDHKDVSDPDSLWQIPLNELNT